MFNEQRRPVDRARLREIVERANKASDCDPELHDRGGDPMGYDVWGVNGTDIRGVRGMFLRKEDASFVARAKQDVSDLVQALQKAWDENERQASIVVKMLNAFARVTKVDAAEHTFSARIPHDQTAFIAGLVMLTNGMLPKGTEVVVSEKGFAIARSGTEGEKE